MAAGHRFVQCLVRCAGAGRNYDWADLLSAKLPGPTLHSRIIAPGFVGTTMADETEESGQLSRGTVPRATSLDYMGTPTRSSCHPRPVSHASHALCGESNVLGSIRQFCSHPRHRRSHRPLARPTTRLIERRDSYSARSTITGSTRDARRAGIAAAITATATTTSGTMMNVIGSVALTP